MSARYKRYYWHLPPTTWWYVRHLLPYTNVPAVQIHWVERPQMATLLDVGVAGGWNCTMNDKQTRKLIVPILWLSIGVTSYHAHYRYSHRRWYYQFQLHKTCILLMLLLGAGTMPRGKMLSYRDSKSHNPLLYLLGYGCAASCNNQQQSSSQSLL